MNSSGSIPDALVRTHIVASIGLLLAGCATTDMSACEVLSRDSRSQISSMLRGVKKARFERHLILLEAGTAMSSQCKSYYIDRDAFAAMPASLQAKCETLGGLQSGASYCTLFYLDGEIVNRSVY